MPPNIVFVFADQLRAQALGYAGDSNVKTPNFDLLAHLSVNCTQAIAECPVCSPSRASLLTGQYALKHGVFVNDVYLHESVDSFGHTLKKAGYTTAYIGKWHLDGHGDRAEFIPKDRRQGFDFWQTLECTHDYNHSFYYEDMPDKHQWHDYDAIAQTQSACQFITDHAKHTPFALFLSWGPPHDPYQTAPKQYQIKNPHSIRLRKNVPWKYRRKARRDLAGYYAHIQALDDCMGQIMHTLSECKLDQDTILVFTSDHGDMLFSLGLEKKQSPWDESIRIPLLIRYPSIFGIAEKRYNNPIGLADLMPTLLGLANLPIPTCVEGRDFSQMIGTEKSIPETNVMIACYWPFSGWRKQRGEREFRGIRTQRYTYVKSLTGPWLLYDNLVDPHQLKNLCNKSVVQSIQRELDLLLTAELRRINDQFLTGEEYLRKWGYCVDESGAVPYKN